MIVNRKFCGSASTISAMIACIESFRFNSGENEIYFQSHFYGIFNQKGVLFISANNYDIISNIQRFYDSLTGKD